MKSPFDEYMKTLRLIQTKMISLDEKAELQENPLQINSLIKYLHTEIAFTKLKHFEVVER